MSILSLSSNNQSRKPRSRGLFAVSGDLLPAKSPRERGFTLIELLVVIAIIAILSVVVILALNPAELLRQSRDSNRLSDLATMNSALGIYAAQGGTGFGSSSIVYISIPDPSATSTSGDQCQGLGLPTAPSGTSYFCEASSSYRNVNGTGWIPINFSTLSAGSPLGSLPQDPINTTTTGNYYTYATNGTQFIVTSIPESTKTKANLANNPQIPDYPEVMGQGSNLTISPLWSPTGLVGYWNFEEGSGTTAFDTSGNQNNGTWSGNTPYYAGGKVGSYAGTFDGSTTYAAIPNISSTYGSSPIFTLIAWVNPSAWSSGGSNVIMGGQFSPWGIFSISQNNLYLEEYNAGVFQISYSGSFNKNQWIQVAVTYNDPGNYAALYMNGQLISSQTNLVSLPIVTNEIRYIGSCVGCSWYMFSGSIDDVRVYNRALSASEIQALYNAEK